MANASKRKAKGKKSSPGITAAQVATVVEASASKSLPPLHSAARRFYAPRSAQAAHPNASMIRIRFADLAAGVLREAGSELPTGFKVFVNDNGAVTLLISNTLTSASSYSPFFDALALKLNQSFTVGDNPWLPFHLAPTDLQFAIYGIPMDAHPAEDHQLEDDLRASIYNSKCFLISGAHFLNPDRQSRMDGKKPFPS